MSTVTLLYNCFTIRLCYFRPSDDCWEVLRFTRTGKPSFFKEKVFRFL